MSSVGVYDDQDRMLSYGGIFYGYNANGDLQSKSDPATGETTAFDYDEFGNLRKVWMPNGETIEYVIDGQNRRVGKKVNGVLVQGFLYGGQLDPVAELAGSTRMISRFAYGTAGHVPDLIAKDGENYRVITDHLGSPRLVVNEATASIVQAMDFDAWGHLADQFAAGFQPFGFSEGIFDDDISMVRFGARDYENGRWATRDIVRFAANATNLYSYVADDPINARDPSGLILQAGDWTGSELIVELRKSELGSALADFIEESETVVTVFGGTVLDVIDPNTGQQAYGITGNGPGETAYQRIPLDSLVAELDVRISPKSDVHSIPTHTLAHELVHAALYIYALEGRKPPLSDRLLAAANLKNRNPLGRGSFFPGRLPSMEHDFLAKVYATMFSVEE